MGGTYSHIPNTNQTNLLFPTELVDKIVEKLPTRDKLVCRLVCQDWYEYLNGVKWEPEVVVNLTDILDAADKLKGSWNSFRFYESTITQGSLSFWNNYSDLITSLHLDNSCVLIIVNRDTIGEMAEENLKPAFLGCPNLKHLALTNCEQYFMLGSKMVQLHKLFHLTNLETLNLAQNKYLNDSILFSILLHTSRLTSINLSDCPITFTNAVFRRFYPIKLNHPVSDLSDFTDNILSFQMLELSYLNTPRSSHLKELIIDCTRIDSNALMSISDTDKYSWTSLSLRRCTEIKPLCLAEFLNFQRNLESLALERTKVTEEHSYLLNLAKIKKLCLEECEITSLKFLENVTSLVELNLNFNGNGLLPSFNWEILNKLRKLRVLKLRGTIPTSATDEPRKLEVCEILKNSVSKMIYLRELDLGNCGSAIRDSLLQEIIKNCKLLTNLKLCKSAITDFGTTGRHVVPVRHLELGRVVGLPENMNTLPETCLSTLKNLRTLSLSKCRDLGDETWKYALNLPYLVCLDLSGCSQLTRRGLVNYIIEQCRNLEEINLSETGLQITGDEQVFHRLRRLPRIKKISGQFLQE